MVNDELPRHLSLSNTIQEYSRQQIKQQQDRHVQTKKQKRLISGCNKYYLIYPQDTMVKTSHIFIFILSHLSRAAIPCLPVSKCWGRGLNNQRTALEGHVMLYYISLLNIHFKQNKMKNVEGILNKTMVHSNWGTSNG